jgi:hypothetical protein
MQFEMGGTADFSIIARYRGDVLVLCRVSERRGRPAASLAFCFCGIEYSKYAPIPGGNAGRSFEALDPSGGHQRDAKLCEIDSCGLKQSRCAIAQGAGSSHLARSATKLAKLGNREAIHDLAG